MNIEELEKINPTYMEYPEPWDPYIADAEIKVILNILQNILGPIQYDVNGQDCTHMATFIIPNAHLDGVDGRFVLVVLSKFQKLFTVTNYWHVKPNVLNEVLVQMHASGFMNVPFSIFAEPFTADFENGRLRDNEVWITLFDYL